MLARLSDEEKRGKTTEERKKLGFPNLLRLRLMRRSLWIARHYQGPLDSRFHDTRHVSIRRMLPTGQALRMVASGAITRSAEETLAEIGRLAAHPLMKEEQPEKFDEMCRSVVAAITENAEGDVTSALGQIAQAAQAAQRKAREGWLRCSHCPPGQACRCRVKYAQGIAGICAAFYLTAVAHRLTVRFERLQRLAEENSAAAKILLGESRATHSLSLPASPPAHRVESIAATADRPDDFVVGMLKAAMAVRDGPRFGAVKRGSIEAELVDRGQEEPVVRQDPNAELARRAVQCSVRRGRPLDTECVCCTPTAQRKQREAAVALGLIVFPR